MLTYESYLNVRGPKDVLEHIKLVWASTWSDAAILYRNEILVCDAVDPNMTFVVPVASAIVERRGGMLIHGAIIAREYGLPCVTGIPDADKIIHTGCQITVDGYLGIVTINTGSA